MKQKTPSKPRLVKKRSAFRSTTEKKFRFATRKTPKKQQETVRYEGKGGAFLAQALCSPKSNKQRYALTHGFHAYPGRFHPHLVRKLLSLMKPTTGLRVFDPFMGGGTTLVESMCQGLEVIGNDLNPIAALVARERCRLRSPTQSRDVLETVLRLLKVIVARQEQASTKIIRRANVSWLRPHYAPHLFVELLHWIDAIDKLPASSIQETLRIVFSSVVFRFSNEALQISGAKNPPPIPKGVVSEWILSKTEELLAQQKIFYRTVPKHTKAALLFTEDISQFQGLPNNSADLIITSPSSPNSYDYHAHYLLQLKWLKLSDHALKVKDLGSKRRYSPRQWKQPFREILFQLRQISKPGGSCYLNIHDWLDREKRINALTYMQKYAPSVGWEILATASLQIPPSNHQKTFYEETGKWQHLLHLKNPQTSSFSPETSDAPEEGE